MNGRYAKKCHKDARKLAQEYFVEYLDNLINAPFKRRWQFAWRILLGVNLWHHGT